jgi:hypothetical protein
MEATGEHLEHLLGSVRSNRLWVGDGMQAEVSLSAYFRVFFTPDLEIIFQSILRV